MASADRNEPPWLLIVAGPNGSGKSSLYADMGLAAFGLSVWIINPDLLSARIAEIEHQQLETANVEAVRRIETWLEASIGAHQSVGVETVLSTPKYRRLVAMAKKLGFRFSLIYVVLDDPDLNVERVRLRVEKGGHAVPEAKIRARRARSLEQLPWFWNEADVAWMIDNSGAEPRLLATRRSNEASGKEDLGEIIDRLRS